MMLATYVDGCFSWTSNTSKSLPRTSTRPSHSNGKLLHDQVILLRSAQNLERQSAQIILVNLVCIFDPGNHHINLYKRVDFLAVGCKKDEIHINNAIKNVEKDLGVVDYELLQRTDVGFLHLTTSRDWYGRETSPAQQREDGLGIFETGSGRTINFKRIGMPIDGAQELNYVTESLVHRIRHGNNKWADEVKLYHEIRNLNDTIEIYTEPTEPDDGPDPWQRRPNLDKRYK
ncbi:hypothetical protein Tco_0005407, partial [Tanacetum coccineum]